MGFCGGDNDPDDDDVVCDRCGGTPGVASDGQTPYCYPCMHECTFTVAEMRDGSVSPKRKDGQGSSDGSERGVGVASLGARSAHRSHSDGS